MQESRFRVLRRVLLAFLLGLGIVACQSTSSIPGDQAETAAAVSRSMDTTATASEFGTRR